MNFHSFRAHIQDFLLTEWSFFVEISHSPPQKKKQNKTSFELLLEHHTTSNEHEWNQFNHMNHGNRRIYFHGSIQSLSDQKVISIAGYLVSKIMVLQV